MMKKRMALSVLAAVMALAGSMTAMAAPEVVTVNGKVEVFDAEYYAAVYPDVVAALGTGRDIMLQHYTAYGQAEGRLSCAPETDVQAVLAAAQVSQPQAQPTEQSGEEEAEFAYLMALETGTPSLVQTEAGKIINSKGITLTDLLERALLFEQYLVKYPNSAMAPVAAGYYTDIATIAITGGYNKAAGIPNYYTGDTPDVVDTRALWYYQQLADLYPNTCLGKTVQEYVSLLNTNQLQINDAVQAFYNELPQKLTVGR